MDGANGAQETLLVAEDTDAVRTVVVKLLESEGYRVLSASDGEEAVRLLSEHGSGIALALLDVVMPKLNGPEAYARIRNQHAHLKVLFTSGYSEGLPDGPAISSAQMLRKPYMPDELIRRIRETLSSVEPVRA